MSTENWALDQSGITSEENCLARDRIDGRYVYRHVETAWRAYLAANEAQAQAVPEIDYRKLIEDCYRTTRQAQGTKGCISFKLGAEWFRDQMLAAAPQPTEHILGPSLGELINKLGGMPDVSGDVAAQKLGNKQ
jgi:hypothetical protein